MPLPTGAISAENINTELGLAVGSSVSFNATNPRLLAAAPTGAVSMNAMRGKSAYVVATGGTITDVVIDELNWRVHRFTSTSAFEISSIGAIDNNVEYEVVGGGRAGGGGGGPRGGGGSGGRVVGNFTAVTRIYDAAVGGNGGASALQDVQWVGTGGAGGVESGNGGAAPAGGGGGGGAGGRDYTPVYARSGGVGSLGKNGGGVGASSTGRTASGGGGGMVGAGGYSSGDNRAAAPGGAGVTSTFDGVTRLICGGGAGNSTGSTYVRPGTYGGGASNSAGVANTGGGGGGGYGGGSGVIAVKYRIP